MKIYFPSSRKAMATQTDWAIALAIFLLFSFFFFILLQQMTHSEVYMEDRVADIAKRFKGSVSFNYSQVPVYVLSDASIENAPILARNPTNWTNYVLEEDIFSTRDDEFIFFIVDVESGSNVFMMRTSEREYDTPPPGEFLTKSSDVVSVPGEAYSVRFYDSVLQEVFYEDTQQLFDFNITLDGQYAEIDETEEFVPGYFAKHNISSDQFNLRSYIFPETSYMMGLFDIKEVVGTNATFGLEFDLNMHEEYYLGPVLPNTIDFSQGCIEETNDILDLVNQDNNSIAFVFDEDVDFEMCDASTIQDPNRMRLTIEIDYVPTEPSSLTRFVMYSHDSSEPGQLNRVLSPDDVHVGVRERFEGISRSKLMNLNSYSDAELLEMWNISEDREFKLNVYDTEGEDIFDFETSEPGQEDVFSRTFGDYLINKFGEREFIYINFNVW